MSFNPDDVLKLTEPTNGFLCPLSANKYGINFKSFSITNYDTKAVLFSTDGGEQGVMEIDVDPSAQTEEDMYRKIRYCFTEQVLRLPLIATS